MSGSLIDVVIVLLILTFGINGYRQGFVVGVLSFAGFFGGALLGLQIAPFVAARFVDPAIRVVAALGVVFTVAVVGQTLAGLLATRIRRLYERQSARVADDIGGAVVSVLAVLLVCWMVAVPMASAGVPGLAKQVRNSAIVRAVDGAMPDAVRGVYDSLRDTVDPDEFPEVFGGLGPTRSRQVAPPDPELARSPVVRQAHESVVKVLGVAPSCARRIEGTGFVYARERVMTNAHVVAGTEDLVVDTKDGRYRARVVAYHPDKDLAVLHVPGFEAPVMRWAPSPAPQDRNAIVLGYPLDGPYTATPARVRDRGEVRGPDIYESKTVVREVYSLRSQVRSGNSGGPLVASDGTVYGVIFAAAADDPDTGYALTVAESRPVADTGRRATRAVSTGDCV
ncbi:MAG TPA: MarP family serine protease [Micromonosporaceae bacterium]